MKKMRSYFSWYGKSYRFISLLKRKIFILLFVIASTTVAFGQKEKVNLNLQNVSIKTLLDEIQKQTNMYFVFSAEQTQKLGNFSIEAQNEELESVLKRVFDHTGFSYEFDKDLIVIRESKEQVPEVVKEEIQTLVTVKGVVKDEYGSPLPGVTIQIKDGNGATVTNVNGQYTLTFSYQEDIVFVFSFIGMVTQEVRYTGKREIDVIMKEDEIQLEGVVVTGYVPIRETSFTGSHTRVTKEELLRVSPSNIIDALQVFDPSLRIAVNNEMGSDPNTLPEFYLRGKSGMPGVSELDMQLAQETEGLSKFALTKNPNTPIFIMDGFEVSVEKVFDLDMSRVENITILKDAAATAMYGSRASNGIIVIETVAPSPGDFQVTYNFTGSVTAPDLTGYNLMNAREKLEAEVAAGLLDGSDLQTSIGASERLYDYTKKLNNILLGVDTYWLSKPLKTEFNHKHNIYVEGGADAIRLGLSLRYENQNGVMKGSLRDRYGIGLTVDYRLKNFNFRNQFTFDNVSSEESPYGQFSNYTKQQPYDSPNDPLTGELVRLLPTYIDRTTVSERLNPLYEATLNNFSHMNYSDFTDNISVNWFITPKLMLKGQFAFNYKISESKTFTDPKSGRFEDDSLDDKGTLGITTAKSWNWNTNLVLSYNNVINKHHLSSSFVFNAKNDKSENVYNSYRGFPSGELNSIAYANKMNTKTMTSDNHTRLMGVVFTSNYTWDDIYLADVSIRSDGSSEFGTDKRFSLFWSVGAGLNMHNYLFMKEKMPLLSQLKLTGNYGITGKANFPPYASRHSYEVDLEDWYKTGIGTYLYEMGNNNLKWERTKTTNLSANIGLDRNKYVLVFRWYNKRTVDMITDVGIASSSGFTRYKDNMGEVENRGIEMDINIRVIENKDLRLSIFGNMAHNTNKLKKLSKSMEEYNARIAEYFKNYSLTGSKDDDMKYSKPFMMYEVGSSLSAITGMKSLGIDPGTGKEVYLKRDGTISYEWDTYQQSVLGDRDPDFQGSFGFNILYKNFSLYTTFMYQWGGQQYNETLVNKVENIRLYRMNADKRVLEQRWRQPGDITKLKAIQDSYVSTRSTSRFVEDYNALTFNSLSLGYDFPKEKIQKLKLSMLKLQFNMKDIFTLSSIKQERGLQYPFARTFNFTLNARF